MKNLQNLKLAELTTEEQVNTEGGIAPLILGAWAVMAGCSAVALGMREAMNEK